LLTGGALIWLNPAVLSSGGWLHAKLVVVALLILLHFYCGSLRRALANNVCDKNGKFFRVLNEMPTLALLAIVFFAVVRPF
ncbi:MAG: CopD family protein, partial [Helicobacter sp.]|nr:CopD family protein [Helicobacter sp.]